MSFGSSQEEENILTKSEEIALDIRNKTHTVAGLLAEMQVQKQQLATVNVQLRGLMELYQTLDKRMEVYQQARLRELTAKVNGGSTSPEDDGISIRG